MRRGWERERGVKRQTIPVPNASIYGTDTIG